MSQIYFGVNSAERARRRRQYRAHQRRISGVQLALELNFDAHLDTDFEKENARRTPGADQSPTERQSTP